MAFQCQTPDCALHLSGAAFPAPMPCPVCQAPLVEVPVAEELPVSRSDFEQRVLDRYPYVIALPYRNMLDEQDGRGRLDLLAYTLQNALKYMGLLVVGEYHASDLRLPQLNELFKHNLYQPSFGNWNQFLREGIAALEKEGHSWVLPEVKEGYAAVETAKRCKKYPVETAYTDEDGQMAYRTIQGTAIGTLINFRNRHLGHGTPLNKAKAEELYGQFKPVLDDLLEGLAFSESLTMVRAERNELYRLTGCNPEPILGRAPEKEDQSKVWVEHEDERRLEIMPFFILPGLVAGADPDSGVLVYEQFTGGKRIVFHGPDNSHGESAGEVLERLKSMIRLKEEEAPISTSEMEEPLFHARLAAWNDGVMAGLHREKKVIPDVYQPREDAETVLRGWTTAQAPLMVIAADAGSGKTNLLAEMTRQYGEFGLPVVLLRAVHLESSNFKSALAAVLNLEEDWKTEELSVLDRPAEQPWMILVDGVNEHAHPEALFDSMLDFLDEAPRQGVKLILTWRVPSPEDLPRVDGHRRDFVYMAEQREGDHALARHALRLSALNREEIKAAWDRYAGHASKLYRPQFSFEDLVSADRALTEQFANPLLLRMFMELFNQRGLKHKPKGMADIWALWWRDQQTREREAQFLEAFAPLVMESGESKVSLDVLFDHDALVPEVRNIQVDSAYQQLLGRGVLTQSFAQGEIEVGFTMEAAMFFVLGELAGRQSWTSADIASRLQESPRWEGPLQSMLRAQVGRGQLDLLCDCIDDLGVPDEFSSIALAQAFLLKPADQVLNALLENPSNSDWIVLENALKILDGDWHVNSLNRIGSVLLGDFSQHISHLCGVFVAISEALDSSCRAELKLVLMGVYIEDCSERDLVRMAEVYCALGEMKMAEKSLRPLFSSMKMGTSLFGVGFEAPAWAEVYPDEFRKGYCLLGEAILALGNGEEAYWWFGYFPSGGDRDLRCRFLSNRAESCELVPSRKEEAIMLYDDLLNLQKEQYGTHHVEVAHAMGMMASALIELAPEKSAELFDDVLAMEKVALGANHPNVAATYSEMGRAELSMGRAYKAIENFRSCLEIEMRCYGASHPAIAITYSNLGYASRHCGDFNGAIQAYQEALDMRIDLLGAFDLRTTKIMLALARTHREAYEVESGGLGKDDHVHYALAQAQRCLKNRRMSVSESDFVLLDVHLELAIIQGLSGEVDASMESYNRCLDILKAERERLSAAVGHQGLESLNMREVEVLKWFGCALLDQGRVPEAKSLSLDDLHFPTPREGGMDAWYAWLNRNWFLIQCDIVAGDFQSALSQLQVDYEYLIDEEDEFLLSYRDLSVARGLMQTLKQMIGND